MPMAHLEIRQVIEPQIMVRDDDWLGRIPLPSHHDPASGCLHHLLRCSGALVYQRSVEKRPTTGGGIGRRGKSGGWSSATAAVEGWA